MVRKWEEIGRNAEFGMENLLASRLVSQSKLPWKFTKRFSYLSFWNNSKYSLNPLPGIPPWLTQPTALESLLRYVDVYITVMVVVGATMAAPIGG